MLRDFIHLAKQIDYILRVFFIIIGVNIGTLGWAYAQVNNSTSTNRHHAPQSMLTTSLSSKNLSIPAFSRQPSQFLYYSNPKWKVQLGGVHLTSPSISPNNQAYPSLSNWLNTFSDDKPSSQITPIDITDWVERLFETNSSESSFQKNIEYDVLDLMFQNNQVSLGVIVEYRSLNQFTLGRAWFESTWIANNNDLLQNQNLSQKGANFFSIGLNYSEKWDVLTNNSPRSDVLSIGFSPRLLFAGDLQLHTLTQNIMSSNQKLHSESSVQVSGSSQDAIVQLISGKTLDEIENNRNPLLPTTTDAFKQGLGYGIDIGVSYLLNIGNETSLATDLSTPLGRVFGLVLNITDIGYIHYKDVSTLTIPFEQIDGPKDGLIPHIPNDLLNPYEGKTLDFFRYLDSIDNLNQLLQNGETRQSLDVILPTKATLGLMLLWNKWRIQTSIEYSFFDTIGSIPSWSYQGQISIEPIDHFMISSGYTSSTVWADEVHLGIGISIKNIQIAVKSHISPSHGGGDLLPQHYSFSGISILR